MYSYLRTPLVKNDFIEAIEQIGITKKDIVFAHSDLRFGIPTVDSDLLKGTLIDILHETSRLPIFPTFSYSWYKSGVYNADKDPCETGTLPNHFLTLQRERTRHPHLSVAFRNIDQELTNYLLDIDRTGYGSKSIFAKLTDLNAKVLWLGAPFSSLTYIHYIEKQMNVPYREARKYKGRIIYKNVSTYEEYEYFTRVNNPILNLKPFKCNLLKHNLLTGIPIGMSSISTCPMQHMLRAGQELLEKNIHAFLFDHHTTI